MMCDIRTSMHVIRHRQMNNCQVKIKALLMSMMNKFEYKITF